MKHVAHLTIHGFIGMGSHNALYPPAPTPAIVPHVSMDTLLGLTLGAKFTTTVIGPFGFQFIQQGNDSGQIVSHIAIPPPSVLVPVVIAFGSSKPMFAASTVKMQGTPVAAGMIPFCFTSINQGCNDPCNYPGDMVICPNTVLVGLTLGDFLGGLLAIGVDCAISAIANKIGGEVAEGVMGAIASRVAAPVMRALSSEMTEAAAREAAGELFERPLALAVQETLGKITENLFGNLVDYDLAGLGAPESGDLGTAAGAAIDAPSGGSASSTQSGTAATTAANSQDYPGAAPIHSAE